MYEKLCQPFYLRLMYPSAKVSLCHISLWLSMHYCTHSVRLRVQKALRSAKVRLLSAVIPMWHICTDDTLPSRNRIMGRTFWHTGSCKSAEKKSVFVKKKKTLRQDQFVEPIVYKLHFNPASQLSDRYILLVNSRITNLYHSIKGKAYQQHEVVILYIFFKCPCFSTSLLVSFKEIDVK